MSRLLSPLRDLASALVRRPAVAAAGVFIGGIVLHGVFPPHAAAYVAFALAAAIFATVQFRRSGRSIFFLCGAIFFSGVAAAQLEAFYFPVNDISGYATDDPRLARIELQLDQPLRILTNAFTAGRKMPPRQVTTATVRQVLTHAGWQVAAGQILVQIDPPNDHLAIGQRIRVLGMLQRPGPSMNPGQFDWASYYREQRILASITLTHGGALQILHADSPSILARIRQAVRDTLDRGFTKEQSLDHALLRALVLGDSDPELRDVQEQFRRTGTSHHLAISGMHVAVLGMLIYWLLRRLRLHPRWITIIAMSAVVFYGLVALPSPPVIRSVMLCVALGLGLLMWRSIDAIQMLAITVLTILILHPLDVYNAGFQLSFVTVLALMIFVKRVMPLTKDRDAEIAINTEGGNPPRRLVIMHSIRQKLAGPIVCGLIAWVFSMPLIAFHFDQLNPWAVIASLLLAIPVFLSLTAGFLKIILTLCVPFASHFWATLAAIPVAWMRHSVDRLAAIPLSDMPLPAHSILFIFVYYGLLLLPLLPIARPRIRSTIRLSPALAVLLLVMVPLTGGAGAPPGESLTVAALAVGAGQCCIVELPDGRLILVDAGSATLSDPMHKCIAPYLRARGRSTIDEIWLADCDFDHIGAVADLIRTYNVARVVVSNRFEQDARGKPADEALLDLIHQRHIALAILGQGDHIQLGKSASIDVLWPPPAGKFGLTNNDDLVMKLNYARRTILFPSDIQQTAQTALLKSPSQLHCDAMLAPHHGSGETTTAAFINAADPLYIVSSNDRTLTQKQFHFEHQIGNRPLFRTNRCGATTITIDRNGGITVTPYLQNE